jgi:protein tyrosine phosphatase
MRILNGSVHLGHRPKYKHLRKGMYNYTHILTLLHEKEGASELGSAIKASGIKWLWFPTWGIQKEIDETLPHIREFTSKMTTLLETLEFLLNRGCHIFIHCSAGIHRTGTVMASLLYHLGYGDEMVMRTLHKMQNFVG